MKRLLFLLSLLAALSVEAVPNLYVGMFTNLGNYVFDQVNTPTTNGAVMTATPCGTGPLSQDPGTYEYKFSYVTLLGETELSQILGGDDLIGPSAQNECLTGIPVSTDARVLRRNIFRFNPSDGLYHYVGTLSNNTATVFTDTVSDATATSNSYRTNNYNTTATFFYFDTNRVPSWVAEYAANETTPRWRLLSGHDREIISIRSDELSTAAGGGILYIGNASDPDPLTALSMQIANTNQYADPRFTWIFGPGATPAYSWNLRNNKWSSQNATIFTHNNAWDFYWGLTNNRQFYFGTNFYWTNANNALLLATLTSNGTFTVAGSFTGNASGLTNLPATSYPITNFTVYAAGTAYTLTGTAALAHFGTTDPSVTINQAGTYLVTCGFGVKYSGATYAAAQTLTAKLRRTNNTAADLAGGSRAVELPVLTTFTGGDAMTTPSVIYTATSGDIIQLFGSVSATPTAGSVLIDSAEIVAIRLY